MTVINIKGDVVDNLTGQIYSYLQIPAVYPATVQQGLTDANGDDVTLQIASNGGDVFAASEIYTMLRQYSGKVNVEIQGLAASAASVIAMAGDNIKMAPTALLMIHRAWSVSQGNTDDMQHEAAVLNKIDQSIVGVYEAKTGMDEQKLLDLMTQETWLTADDATKQGFADEIMFVDENKPQVLNSVSPVASKNAVNKLLNLINKASSSEKNSTHKHEKNLQQSKLAILMSKKE
ncbi:head maturation protease, ClpP-related [Lapidilactobacillus wuchangensis]|uniref:head maturation protease, ClpP-related n=1 Tax=Lapidilactobacillus wuchangensis TaxID=2486001 RepID=UPI000F77FBF3|nr:head maturation protease, ClpP-related [Lapidilactobacillus wuchangensis]